MKIHELTAHKATMLDDRGRHAVTLEVYCNHAHVSFSEWYSHRKKPVCHYGHERTDASTIGEYITKGAPLLGCASDKGVKMFKMIRAALCEG